MESNAGPAPGHKGADRPKLPSDFDLDTYTSTPMTNWFSPKVLLKTGIRTLLSSLFAAYADKRAIIAALKEAKPDTTWANKKDIWIDYVADVGDGWNSTYSIAWCLAQLKQVVKIDNKKTDLPRGDILIMGGDQVYPYASIEQYKTKLVRPYQAALPCTPEKKHPFVFAIPGNHDWYDGLRGFMRRFCQGAWLGGWQTKQTRPYWSIQLAHGWWLWGVDIQLDDYIDQAQAEFFRLAAIKLKAGHRVILCVAEPSWIFATTSDNNLHRNIAFIENEIIAGKKAHLVATLSGDLHHFVHYKATDSASGIARHKITCGGGGAFTHGTHKLPEPIELTEQGEPRTYHQTGTMLPDRSASRWLLLWNIIFPLRHLGFAAVLGGFYLTFALALTHVGVLGKFAAIPLDCNNLSQVFEVYIKETFAHLWALVFFVLLLGSTYLFARPDWSSNPSVNKYKKLAGGLAHSIMHLAYLVPLLWAISHWGKIDLWPFAPNWEAAWKFSLTMFLAGGLGGGVVFGIYLSLSNLFFGFHRTEAFSAVRSPHNKSFLRMHLTNKGLVIYPLGLEESEEKWKENKKSGENKSWISPANGLKPELICGPIEIKS